MAATDRRDGDWRRPTLGRAWAAAVLVAADAALLLIASVVWTSASSDVDTTAVTMLGVSAIAGIPALSLVIAANVRAARSWRAGQPLKSANLWADWGVALAVIGLVGMVLYAFVVVLAGVGDGSFDLADSYLAAIAVLDSLLGALVAFVTHRSISRAS